VIPSQPLDTPLWAFALAVYGGDGVADECLDLQERLGLDVNILLFAAFIGAVEAVQLESQDITAASAAVADWQSEIVRPLRQVRRALKPMSAEGLRAQVKVAELEAEKIELAMLWQWSRSQLADRPHTDRDQSLATHLRGVLEFYGQTGDEIAAVPRLRDAAAAYGRL
jgi:uncharacterized protein (TIGR02444 family)